MSDNIESRIIGLLSGEINDEHEIASLLQELALLPGGTQILTDHLAMSRGMSQLFKDITPDTDTDKYILQRVEAAGRERTTFQGWGRWFGRGVAGVVLLLSGLFLSDLFDLNLLSIQEDRGWQGEQKMTSSATLDGEREARSTDNPQNIAKAKNHQLASLQATYDSLSIEYNRVLLQKSTPSQIPSIKDSEIRILDFDGVDDCVLIPDEKGEINPGASFTIEAYVRPDNLEGKRWIATYTTPDSGANFLFGFDEGRLRLTTYDRYHISNNLLSDTRLYPGVWYHVVGTQDSGSNTLQVYINGRLEGDLSGGGKLSGGIEPGTISFGGWKEINNKGDKEYFDGLIQKIRIWKQTVTQQDVVRIASQESQNILLNPIEKWSFLNKDVQIPIIINTSKNITNRKFHINGNPKFYDLKKPF